MITSNETLGMTHEEFLFHDVPAFAPLSEGEGLDWLGKSESPCHVDEEDDFFADGPGPFSDTFMPDSELDNAWADEDDDEITFELVDQVLSSGTSSPTNDAPFSSSSSDADVSEPATKRKGKAASVFEDAKAKKGKGKKGAVSKPVLKQMRRFQDDATIKVINTLRAEAGDHPDSRRRIHNVLERKRRNDLKYCYQELRESIPELEATERTPTGTILARAADYIRRLQEEEKKIEAGLNAARVENELLRRQLGMF